MSIAVAVAGSAARVWTLANGVFPSNCYLHATDVPGECILVDPGLDAERIEQALSALALTPRAVVCTHGHFDHAGSAAHFQERHGCPVYLHERDLRTLGASNFLLMAFRIPARVRQPRPERVDDGTPALDIGGLAVRWHPVPGHTPGSCAIEIGKALFTGDTLYARGVGLAGLPGEDATQLRRSVRSILDGFADDTLILPGHGESATLGWIRDHNDALRGFLEPAPCTPASSS